MSSGLPRNSLTTSPTIGTLPMLLNRPISYLPSRMIQQLQPAQTTLHRCNEAAIDECGTLPTSTHPLRCCIGQLPSILDGPPSSCRGCPDNGARTPAQRPAERPRLDGAGAVHGCTACA